MKTTFLSALAFGACASVALAEAVPSVVSADSIAERPVALTETQMDKVTAGARSENPKDIVVVGSKIKEVVKAASTSGWIELQGYSWGP